MRSGDGYRPIPLVLLTSECLLLFILVQRRAEKYLCKVTVVTKLSGLDSYIAINPHATREPFGLFQGVGGLDVREVLLDDGLAVGGHDDSGGIAEAVDALS